MFALGSSDKSIRMWKFKDVGPLDLENYHSEESEEEYVHGDGDEIENQIFAYEKREEHKGDAFPGKFAPVRQSYQGTSGTSSQGKLQLMRKQRKQQDNLKRTTQKENEQIVGGGKNPFNAPPNI